MIISLRLNDDDSMLIKSMQNSTTFPYPNFCVNQRLSESKKSMTFLSSTKLWKISEQPP